MCVYRLQDIRPTSHCTPACWGRPSSHCCKHLVPTKDHWCCMPQRTVLVGRWAGKVLGEKSFGWKRQSEMISLLISFSHCSNDSLWAESLSSLCGVTSGHSKLCCRNCSPWCYNMPSLSTCLLPSSCMSSCWEDLIWVVKKHQVSIRIFS